MKKWVYNALLVLFAAVFLVSAGFLVNYYIQGRAQQDRYNDLASVKDETTPRPTIVEDDAVEQPEQPEQPPAMVEVTDPTTGQTVSLLPEFAELYLQNNHIIGWLTIPGTNVDYPVMQNPEDPDFYLRRNFDKKNSKWGCMYTWPQCDVWTPSDNITIYGHHMRDGSMFAQLDQFRDPEFRNKNRYIFFDTLQSLHTYEVMAVFLTSASVGKGFPYHEFVDAPDEEAFNDFVSQIHKLQLYDSGVTAQYGDKLICLSTCEYSQTNGRLVVVAKRVA